MGIKMSPKRFPGGMWWHGYVKYEEAEVDRLVLILKQITAAADRVEYSKQPASARAA